MQCRLCVDAYWEAGCWGENYGLDVTPAVLPGPYRELVSAGMRSAR